jgi:hypothetical protein
MSEVIEWGIRVPLVSNVGILVDVLLVFFVSAMIAGGLLYVNGFVDAYSVLRLFVMTCFAHRFIVDHDGVCIHQSTPALIRTGLLWSFGAGRRFRG